jgi:uroporphyrin-III C-methyltransferase / precorrin-2 dehydrogenase / sirohydrochlorin ferrochelatase
MNQLPIFMNLNGARVVLVGDGEAADAKRRLIERAGGVCVDDCPQSVCKCARIAFIALDDDAAALVHAKRLRAKGMIVNVVDRPAFCDFTTPAIIDRDPVLIAIGTGGASAGMAKAIRQRLETILPASLGRLAAAVSAAKEAIHSRWPNPTERRRSIDAAFAAGGALDPFSDHDSFAVADWLGAEKADIQTGLIEVNLTSNNPDDLTLRTARLLGEADHIFYEARVSPFILTRARADAVRYEGAPPEVRAEGLSLYLRLPGA